MAMSPALAGLALGRGGWWAAWLTALWALCYCVEYTGARWFKSRFKRTWLAPFVAYCAVLAAAGIPFVALCPGVLRWAVWFTVLAAVAMLGAYLRRERSLWSNAAQVLAASSMAAVVYSFSDGVPEAERWAVRHIASTGTGAANVAATADFGVNLWPAYAISSVGLLAAAAFACMQFASVLFVKTMIRHRGEPAYYGASIGWCVLAAFAGFLVSPTLGILGLLLAAKATVAPPMAIRRNARPIVAGVLEAVSAVIGWVLIVWALWQS